MSDQPEYMTMTHDVTVDPKQTAMLVIDVQNFTAHRKGQLVAHLSDADFDKQFGTYWHMLHKTAVPNIQRLLSTFRHNRMEVVYTCIERLTADGRDNCPLYKTAGFNVGKGSWDGKVIEEIAPVGDEIVFPKSSSSVFVSTHIDYVLRNMGIKHLFICGLMTDQCIESAVRDAADLGYTVSLITDACAALSQEIHDIAISKVAVYCNQTIATDDAIALIDKA